MLVLQWSILPWIFLAHYQHLTVGTSTLILCQIISQFICHFGMDQGQNFESKLMAEVCELLEIKKTRTTAYHPQSDGMVERFTQTLEAHLSKLADHNQLDWDWHLLFLMVAYCSAVHDTTGNTMLLEGSQATCGPVVWLTRRRAH